MAGMVLLGLGMWFLLSEAGYDVPGLERLWPLFLILAGVASFGSFLAGGLRQPKRVAAGVTTILLGFFFLLFTLGPLDWSLLAVFWPVFPLVAGIAMLARWAAGLGHEPRELASAFTAILVGVVGLAFTATPLRGLFGWPVILVLVGMFLIGRAVLGVVFGSFGWAGRRLS